MFFSMVVREQNFECMLVLDPPAAATIMTLLLCNDLARADESARTSSSSPTATPEVQTCIQFSTSNQCSMYTFLGETQFWFKRKKNHFFFFFPLLFVVALLAGKYSSFGALFPWSFPRRVVALAVCALSCCRPHRHCARSSGTVSVLSCAFGVIDTASLCRTWRVRMRNGE